MRMRVRLKEGDTGGPGRAGGREPSLDSSAKTAAAKAAKAATGHAALFALFALCTEALVSRSLARRPERDWD